MKNKLGWFKSLPVWLAFRLLVLSFVRRVFKVPVTFSYAQGAEDILISYLTRYHLSMSGPGKFVDVGCNTPVRYSNTFDLYLNGWRGLNIDANGSLVAECKRVRKQDVCIQAAVSDSEREVTFHKARDHAVSTIDETRLVEWKKHFEFSDEDRETVMTKTLSSILDKNWTQGEELDLLTVDVEGHDLQVLKSLDLAKYRPKIIVVEMHDFEGIVDSPIYKYLTVNGYSLVFFAVLNAYFVYKQPAK